MKTLVSALSMILGASAFAQPPAPVSGPPIISEPRSAFNQVKNNLIKMAEKMPSENYDFKPVPEIRSFGELMAHIADSQTRTCSMVNGQAKTPDAASKKSKDDIVAALKAAVAECDAAWEGTTEANALTMISSPRGQRSRVGLLTASTVTHNNEEYGYAALYLRLKGIVPPSSEGRPMAAPGPK